MTELREPIISIEGLGKKYPLSSGGPAAGARYETLREALTARLRRPWRRRTSVEDFWALREVSFEVQPGERVGIIGRNGAGKSTLLRILSRITEPTTGRVVLRGRLASLLEVGTGFHPELTGRENIFLNGAILGMSGVEIRRKFDEIVDFAEIARFLDLPVKRYSSGMYVRLAFAVAAHLDPDVLVVDEVLAVGDVAFQQKCLKKMNDVSVADGRTVLFVTHDMNVLLSLCERCVLLERGRIVADDQARQVVDKYLHPSLGSASTLDELNRGQREVHVTRAQVWQGGEVRGLVRAAEPVDLRIAIEVLQELGGPSRVYLSLVDEAGRAVFSSSECDVSNEYATRTPTGSASWTVAVPPNLLRPGNYDVRLGVDIRKTRVVVEHDSVLRFEVYDDRDATVSERFARPGVVAPLLTWRQEEM